MNSATQTITATCPACETRIRFGKVPHMGQLVTCPECEEALEVVRRAPLTLDWAYDDDNEVDEEVKTPGNGRPDDDDDSDWEDWDDDDDDDDYDDDDD